MYRLSLVVLFVVSQSVLSQELTVDDFRVGGTYLGEQIDSVIQSLGSPHKIKLGDSLLTVERAYGMIEEWQKRKELNRLWDLYDTSFSDFDFLFDYEYRTGDWDGRYLAFYFKNNCLVKIYMWLGLSD